MKSLLNLILIAIACSFANAATSTKSITNSVTKTVTVTVKTTSTKTLPITTNNIIYTKVISDPLIIQYYTTSLSYGVNYYTTVLPNNRKAYDVYGCIPTKGYKSRVVEDCSTTSSLTYCKPSVITMGSVSTYCSIGLKN